MIFETASTVSNNSLTIGITTMDLDSISKMILSFNMIMGRFEIKLYSTFSFQSWGDNNNIYLDIKENKRDWI